MFHDKYTTTILVANDTSKDKIEKDKTVISSDTMAICEQLELLRNMLGNK